MHQQTNPADMARVLKSISSKYINEHKILPVRFEWQTGYGAFAVSKSLEDTVRAYILNQEEHHRHHKLKDEFLSLLIKHGITWQAEYLPDLSEVEDSAPMELEEEESCDSVPPVSRHGVTIGRAVSAKIETNSSIKHRMCDLK